MPIKPWRRRRDSKQQDQFVSLSFRVWAIVQQHVMPILVGVATVAAIVGAVGIWRHFARKAAVQATTELTAVFKTAGQGIAKQEREGESEGESKQTGDSADPQDQDDEDKFGSAAARAQALLKDLERVESRGDKIGRQGWLIRASALMDLGKFDDAISTYRRFLEETRDTHPLRPFAHEGIGYALEAKGDLDGAFKEFHLMALGEQAPFRDRALWHEGRVREKQGKKEEARKAFEMILQDEKLMSSPIRDDAKVRLAALEE